MTLLQRFKAYQQRYTTLNNNIGAHTAFVCFGLVSEQTAIISLYSINWFGFYNRGEGLLRGTDWVLM
jgi:hypothetical protein